MRSTETKHSIFKHGSSSRVIKNSTRNLPLQFRVTADNNSAYENVVRIASKHAARLGKCIAKLSNKENTLSLYYPVLFDDKISDENEIPLHACLRTHLCYGLNKEPNIELIDVHFFESNPIHEISVEVERCLSNNKNVIKLNNQTIHLLFTSKFSRYPLIPGQILLFPYQDGEDKLLLEIKVKSINGCRSGQALFPALYTLDENSQINFSLSSRANNINLTGGQLSKGLKFDFRVKGIGGHKHQLDQLLREAFYSRALPLEYSKAYGGKHTKGILLYGPPGTGKTLIARAIASIFPKDKVKVVNGPELKDKLVGESQANLRNVFRDTVTEWREKGEESDLHVIIFDEIDALCPIRGSRSGGGGVDDDMVAQMLTLLDGFDSPQNMLVIGTTNRKDLIDPAVFRPGRIEVLIEIHLPDMAGREEILLIHTEQMRTHGLLSKEVDLHHLAEMTENYTGAEIEQLVKKARQYAMASNFDISSDHNELMIKESIKSKAQLEKVTNEHFLRAFDEITPAFGKDKKSCLFNKDNFIIYNEQIKKIIDDFKTSVNVLNKNRSMHKLQLLISGMSGVGKTALALYLAYLSGASYIKTLSSENLAGLPLNQQLNIIDDEFHHARRAGLSVIILDELENLLGADAELRTYNNTLRLKYESILKNIAESEGKCIVIATTQSEKFISKIKLSSLFNESVHLNTVSLKYAKSVACQEILSSLANSLGYTFMPDDKEDSQDKREINLPIRDLIYKIQKYGASEENQSALDGNRFYNFVQAQESESKEYNQETSSPLLTQRFF
jgi:vesicle-fusing ATPase